MTTEITCAHCGKPAMKEVAWVNRSRRMGMNVYCSRVCSGLGRRVERTDEEWKRLKAEYDRERRTVLGAEMREQKREYHRRTYDPAKARERRKARASWHVEYCRKYYADPARKREKYEYDRQRRAEMTAGEYAECMILLTDLWKEIRRQQPSWYERAKTKGFLEKLNERKRNERAERRSRHTA